MCLFANETAGGLTLLAALLSKREESKTNNDSGNTKDKESLADCGCFLWRCSVNANIMLPDPGAARFIFAVGKFLVLRHRSEARPFRSRTWQKSFQSSAHKSRLVLIHHCCFDHSRG
jgi:hypothetical protein